MIEIYCNYKNYNSVVLLQEKTNGKRKEELSQKQTHLHGDVIHDQTAVEKSRPVFNTWGSR